jgi:hypothetical protein
MLFLLLIQLSVRPAQAENERGERWVSIAVHAGNPTLLAASVGFVKVKYFEFGLHFGFAPIDPLVQTQVRLGTIQLSLDAGQYSLHPRGSYSMTNFGGYVRVLPFDAPWYLEVDASYYSMGGSLTADLHNSQTGAVSGNAVSGSVFMGAPALTIAAGRHFLVTKDFFFSISLGATIPFSVQNRVLTSSNASAVLPLVPGAEASFQAATQQIQSEADAGVITIKNALIVMPALTLTMGFML